MNSQRHAYMILCHNNWQQLKMLLKALDNSNNDIYIHIDKKAHFTEEMRKELIRELHFAKTEFVRRISVHWGAYSLIEAELILLKCATATEHQYYHLLSGVDLPLKSQDQIYAFFREHDGMEFIDIEESPIAENYCIERTRFYYPLRELVGRHDSTTRNIGTYAEAAIRKVQRILRINRLKNYIKVYKGSQWFSITHTMACYVLSREREIHRHFGACFCADEFFLQTIAMDSPYKDNICSSNMRKIDWERGKPYTWTAADYDELIQSSALWARKFDVNREPEIIRRICEAI